MAKYINKKTRISTGTNITKDIEYSQEDTRLNTPIIIKYKDKFYKISGNNYINQKECTWKCSNRRKKYNNSKNSKNSKNKNFCNATIKGQRDPIIISKFNFYLKSGHSDKCEELCSVNKKMSNKSNNKNKREEIKFRILL